MLSVIVRNYHLIFSLSLSLLKNEKILKKEIPFGSLLGVKGLRL